jgi:hypothetical protein
VGVNEYALEQLARDRLAELRTQAAAQRLAQSVAGRAQGWLRRAMTASSWHFLQPYAVRPKTPGASSAAS